MIFQIESINFYPDYALLNLREKGDHLIVINRVNGEITVDKRGEPFFIGIDKSPVVKILSDNESLTVLVLVETDGIHEIGYVDGSNPEFALTLAEWVSQANHFLNNSRPPEKLLDSQEKSTPTKDSPEINTIPEITRFNYELLSLGTKDNPDYIFINPSDTHVLFNGVSYGPKNDIEFFTREIEGSDKSGQLGFRYSGSTKLVGSGNFLELHVWATKANREIREYLGRTKASEAIFSGSPKFSTPGLQKDWEELRPLRAFLTCNSEEQDITHDLLNILEDLSSPTEVNDSALHLLKYVLSKDKTSKS